MSPTDWIEPANWMKRRQEGRSDAWMCVYGNGWIHGYAEGRREENEDIVRDLLIARFGSIDEELELIFQIITMKMTRSELCSLLLMLPTISREKLLIHINEHVEKKRQNQQFAFWLLHVVFGIFEQFALKLPPVLLAVLD